MYKIETTIVYWGYMGNNEKKMETTTVCLGLRVYGFWVDSLGLRV